MLSALIAGTAMTLTINATNPASMSRLIMGLLNRLVIICAISFLRVKKLIGFCTKQIPVLLFFNYNKTGNYYWDNDLSQKNKFVNYSEVSK
jgi:hypothetical protein